ncbi:MAG: CHAT domain-containing protein [Deltaproteobacteria bacterium]|nr:CHAT domain-containing protein [Myxococcales bacterium]MDP3218991.1 CHAT domain-containing protein [Deltaproteobacteria bacterium]
MARRDRRPHGSKPQSPSSRPPEVRRSLEAIAAQGEYDAAIVSTIAGLRSKTLRDQAEVESARHEDRAAHALYLEAAALFAQDDDSAAAAACWYDLGWSYTLLTVGVREENQLQARALFERALRSPVRQRTPLRLALTHDALGRTARSLAELGRGDARTLLADAEHHLGRACAITESLGPVGLVDAAGYRHNHGNLLFQLERWDAAERSFRRAIEHAAAARRDPEQLGFFVRRPLRPLEPTLHLGLARTLLGRGRRGDVAAALRWLERVIHDGDAPMVAEAHLLAAMALLRAEPDRSDAAHAHLHAVTLWDLAPDQRRVYLRTLRDAGHTDMARRALRLALASAMQRRAATIADHASDHGAREAQAISLLAAELHADAGRPVEAFLALEESAALRYFERVHAQGWSPRDAQARALALRRDVTAAGASALDDLASRITYLTDVQRSAKLDEYGEALARDLASKIPRLDAEHAAETARVHRRVIEALRSARPAPSPSAALREAAAELGAESLHANEVLVRRDPEADHRTREGSSALNSDGLRRLLEHHPGDVLLRVSLQEGLLAVGVWIEDGALTGRSLRRTLAKEEIRALSVLYASASSGGDAPKGESVSDVLASLLPALDLDAALPARAIEHLVVLPSTFAALIPWAAAGAPGCTLLHRADAISYLPNLAPRTTEQHVAHERVGTVLIAPGAQCYEQPTRFHDVAFSAVREGEAVLLGADATRDRVVRAAERADVVSIYTHGLHLAGDGAALSLAGGSLALDDLGHCWSGCERVELWACQSGVNLPTDWLTPVVDEAFGIDAAFHHAGVRSTIGSFWSVPALVTAHLVRRYRERLATGRTPPQALADAQRWWRDAVLTQLPEILHATPEHRVSDAVSRLLGTDIARADLDATLGAMRALLTASDQAFLLREFSTPEAWAGFRFLGVAGSRPVVSPRHAERPLTPDERAEVEGWLLESREPASDIDEFHRERLAAATALDHCEHPTSAQAVAVARAYAERGLGSMRHNLLRALAWVHEPLAAPAIAAPDRRALAVEAAWLWTEIARGELDAEALRPLFPTDFILLQRARALLDACVAAPEHPLLHAWIDRLDARSEAPAGEDLRRWPTLRGAVEACADRWSKLRAAALAVEWLLAHDSVPEAIVREALDLADTALGARGTRDTHLVAQRLRSGVSMLALRLGEFRVPPDAHVLSAREIARRAEWFARADRADPEFGVDGRTVTSEGLDRLEGIHWGMPSDELIDFWDSSGTPGLAWHRVSSAYFTGRFRGASEPRLALHHLASMQLGADLRLAALNRQAQQLPPGPGGDLPGTAAWSREHVLQRLEDLARLAELDPSTASVRPSSADGFRRSAAELLELGARSPMALTAWDLASTVTEDQRDLPAARTGAFLVERALLATDAAMPTRCATSSSPDRADAVVPRG